jgi:hypothetical protein
LKSEKFQQTSTSNVKSTNESPEKAYNKQFDSDVSKSRNKILSSNAHEPIQKVGKETKSEVDTSTPRKNSSNSIEIVIASIGTLIFSILIASGFRRYRQKNKLQQVVEEVKLATLPENILPILEEEEVDFREQKIDGDEREQEPKQNQLYVLITPGLIL